MSTRLLVYAGQLIARGLVPRRACTVAVTNSLTDDAEMTARRRAGERALSSRLTPRREAVRQGAKSTIQPSSRGDHARVSKNGSLPIAMVVMSSDTAASKSPRYARMSTREALDRVAARRDQHAVESAGPASAVG